jgi:hypothetical protein
MPASLRAAFGAWGGSRRYRIGTMKDLALYRQDLKPMKRVWFMDKTLATLNAMRLLGLTQAGPFKHTIKRRSRRRN